MRDAVHEPRRNGHVRGQTPAMSCQDMEKGAGVDEIFGIATRAIDENGDGWHAWQMLTSHATERKTNASSIVKPHSSTSSRAASSLARRSASRTSAPAVACATHAC